MSTNAETISAEELAETMTQLPPLPQTTSQIISILGDPFFEVSDLIKVIALDPTLTANLLRVANSASYSRSHPAKSVGDAIVRLGSGTILAMAMAESARPKSEYDLTAFQTNVDEYWRHCVGSVAVAEELNSRRIARFGSGFSAAALLHDFGKLILSRHLTPERLEALKNFRSEHPGSTQVGAERRILGVDHATAGAMVARQWKLADDIVTSIESHHSPVNWEHDLTNGVILASQMAQENAGKTTFTLEAAEIVADAMLALGIDDHTYSEAANASYSRYENLLELFSA